MVDNASTDGSAEAASAVPGVRLIALPANVGFAAANNAGIRATAGDLILLLNSDTVVPPGAIDGLVAALVAAPDAAAAGPRLVDGAGQPELSFGAMVSPLAEWRQKRIQAAAARGDRSALAAIDVRTRTPGRPDWVSGACLLVRRADAEAVGLIDERYFMYLEDVDFCAALRARGRQVLFVPDVTITHLRGRSRQARPDGDGRALPRQPPRLLRQAPPLLGAAARAVPAPQGRLIPCRGNACGSASMRANCTTSASGPTSRTC